LFSTIYVDYNDNIYIGWNGNGLFKFDFKGNLIKSYIDNEVLKVWKIDEEHVIFTGNPVKENFKYQTSFITDNKKTVDFLPYNIVQPNSLFAGADAVIIDSLFLCSYINTIFISDGRKTHYFMTFPSDICGLSKSPNDILWVCTRADGVYGYEKTGDQFIQNYHFFNDLPVSCIIRDMEGGYWISTLTEGVYYLPNLNIYLIKNKYLPPNQENNIYAISLGKEANSVWFVDKYNLYNLKSDKINTYPIPLLYFKNNFKINDLEYDKTKEQIYIAIDFAILRMNTKVVDPVIKSFKCYYQNKVRNSLSRTILFNKDLIYSATYSSLDIIKTNGQIIYVSKNDQNIKNIKVTRMVAGEDNTIWCATYNGLWKYASDSLLYLGNINKKLTYKMNDICIWPDSPWLLMGTKGFGAIAFNYKTQQIFQITNKNGLVNDDVRCIAANNHSIWIGTNKGLDQLTFNSMPNAAFEIRHLNQNNSLPSNCINDVMVTDSMVYVATTNGFVYFNESKVPKNTIAPPIVIDHIKIGQRDTTNMNFYDLTYNQNHIVIQFVGLTFRNAGKVTYEYQMAGFDDEWHKTQTNEISFLSLSPGNYTFKVVAINEDGVKSKKPAIITIHIQLPYWQTWWFFTLIIMGTIGLTGFVFFFYQRIKIREVKKQNLLKQELIRTRQRSLAQQMNPHFIYNALNSIQYYIYIDEKEKSNAFLAKFAQLMRMILNNSQHETILIEEELDTIQLYLELEKMRFKDKFDFEIVVDEHLDKQNTRIPSLLIQPFIENAILHGISNKREGSGKILLELQNTEGGIKCIIEDNGIGRTKSEELNSMKGKNHISLGTSITEKRLQLINDFYGKRMQIQYIDLKDESNQAKGTRIEVIIPLNAILNE
jgi:hypothetical protein